MAQSYIGILYNNENRLTLDVYHKNNEQKKTDTKNVLQLKNKQN